MNTKQKAVVINSKKPQEVVDAIWEQINTGWRVVTSIPVAGGVIVVYEATPHPTDHRMLPVV